MEKEVFEQFRPIADAFSKILAPYAEVIIHDLETQKIVHIVNNFSKREVGYPSNLEDVDFSQDRAIIGPYEKINWDSRKLKSISTVLRDGAGTAVGLMCINIDVSMIDQVDQLIRQFIRPDSLVEQPRELFRDEWHEKVNAYIHQWAREHDTSFMTLKIPEKKALVAELYARGAFKAPKSPEYVAGVLGLGRATVFKYLKEIKGKQS